MRHDIEFRTEDDVILRGWHYLPDRAGRAPTVVMAHGYSAVKEMYLDRFWCCLRVVPEALARHRGTLNGD
jgi:cephalosporin-C deacetylase-like acetyl esterase